MSRFYPDATAESAYALTPGFFKEKNVKCVIFDIDNTLVPYSVRVCPEKTDAFLSSFEDEGIAVAFVSNNKEERVKTFVGEKRFFVEKAGKPLAKGAREVARHFGIGESEIAVVGDQIFTDVAFAKNAGAFAVLVPPIDRKNEPWYFVFKRAGERVVLYFYNKRR